LTGKSGRLVNEAVFGTMVLSPDEEIDGEDDPMIAGGPIGDNVI
jgi:hypothetical protein